MTDEEYEKLVNKKEHISKWVEQDYTDERREGMRHKLFLLIVRLILKIFKVDSLVYNADVENGVRANNSTVVVFGDIYGGKKSEYGVSLDGDSTLEKKKIVIDIPDGLLTIDPPPTMTKDGFEENYARNSNMTVEELHNLGLHAYPCNCGMPDCYGWQMIDDTPLSKRMNPRKEV